jgi:hypothetical protein
MKTLLNRTEKNSYLVIVCCFTWLDQTKFLLFKDIPYSEEELLEFAHRTVVQRG